MKIPSANKNRAPPIKNIIRMGEELHFWHRSPSFYFRIHFFWIICNFGKLRMAPQPPPAPKRSREKRNKLRQHTALVVRISYCPREEIMWDLGFRKGVKSINRMCCMMAISREPTAVTKHAPFQSNELFLMYQHECKPLCFPLFPVVNRLLQTGAKFWRMFWQA